MIILTILFVTGVITVHQIESMDGCNALGLWYLTHDRMVYDYTCK